MMKHSFSLLITAGLIGLPVLATAQSVGALDANGDGLLTIDEVQLVMPDMTAEDFAAIDLNADGALDGSEVQSAQEAGLMPS
jgi:hypothetical protein